MSFRPDSHLWKDLGRGLLYSVPVVAVAAVGAREVIRLRSSIHEAEAGRLTAERALARAEERLAARDRQDDRAWTSRLRAAAEAAETQGAAEERLTRVVEFLKQEVATAETTIDALRRRSGPSGDGPAASTASDATTAGLLQEISRLNAEIDALRAAKTNGP